MFDNDNSFSISSQLYPRQGSVTGNLNFTIWLLTTTVNSVFQDPTSSWSDDSPWIFQPLTVRETLNLGENVRINEEFQFDVMKSRDDGLFARSLTSVDLWNLYGSLTYEWMEAQVYKDGSFEPAGTSPKLLPSYVTLGYDQTGRDRLFWKNRIRMNTVLDISWYMNIEQFTDNNLNFSLTFNFWLYKFLELSITTRSYNNRTFQYFQTLVDELPGDKKAVNPVVDLLKSFDFFGWFGPNSREESAFNLQSISVDLTHHLHDWNLKFSYTGKPELNTSTVPQQYVWGSTFSIFLQWIPIPEFRGNVKGELDVETDSWDISPRG
jgi:hypothetical protein